MTKRSVSRFALLLLLSGGCASQSPAPDSAGSGADSGEADGESVVGLESSPEPEYWLESELPGDILPDPQDHEHCHEVPDQRLPLLRLPVWQPAIQSRRQ